MFFAGVGGEADEVVDDDVDGAADGITSQAGIVHGFRGDALSGESGVPVHQNREVFRFASFAGAVLLGAGASHGDGIDGFEVAGIRSEVNMNLLSAGGYIFSGRAHVVLHVAGPQDAAGIDVFKFSEYLFGGAIGDVDHDIQASTMTHAHHQFHGAAFAGYVENLVNGGQQGGATFERESLVAEIALLQGLLEQIGAQQNVEGMLLIDCDRCAFDLFLDPEAALGVGDVHELDADAAAIDAAGFAGPLVVAGDFEVGMRLRGQQAERIELGLEIAELAKEGKDALALVFFDDSVGRGLGRSFGRVPS